MTEISKPPRFAFAGDRDLSVTILRWMIGQHARPAALLVTEPAKASHADELIQLCPFLPPELVLRGRCFRAPKHLEVLRRLELDYIVSIHFPYIVPPEVLALPRVGVLNLHPAFLPYNRGWHTPTWAILEGTPVGATLHFMDDGVDTGDVVRQEQLEVGPGDTAHSLYARLKQLEIDVFTRAWPQIATGKLPRHPQDKRAGSSHRRSDLFADAIQRVELEQTVKAGDLIRRLRALTTNSPDEAAYYEADGERYRIQVVIQRDVAHDATVHSHAK